MKRWKKGEYYDDERVVYAHYPNGILVLYEDFFGNNRDYVALRDGEEIGMYHVENAYPCELQRSWGELLGNKDYVKLWDWLRAVRESK